MRFKFSLTISIIISLSTCSCSQSDIQSWYYLKTNSQVLLKKEKKKDIIVGVIDSGINESFLQFFNEGTIVEGYDFIEDDYHPYSKYNLHGSYLCYLIAGKQIENSIGLDSRLKIMPIRVFDESGNADKENIYDGIKFAIEHNCSIINMSFASSKYDSDLDSLFQNNEDVKFIASVGDFSADEYCYPANYEKVIPVSAVDENGNLYKYSNTSIINQSIHAPGVDLPIVSVNANDKIIKTTISGSSYAAAIASGIIGSLMLSESLNIAALNSYDVYTKGYFDCDKLIKTD